MWIPVFGWWALIISALSMLVALATRDERWLQYMRRVTFISAVTAIGIFATAGAYEPSAVAPLLPVILMTLALTVATILITDTRMGRLLWRASAHRAEDDSLWTAVVRIVNDAPSLDSLLMGVASVLRRTTGAHTAVVYKVMGTTQNAAYVGTATADFSPQNTPVDDRDLRSLAKRCLADCRIAEYRHRPLSERLSRSADLWAMVPMQSDTRPYAAILLAQPKADVTNDRNSRTLAAISRYVGQTIQSWLTTVQFMAQENVVANTELLESRLEREEDFARGLSTVVDTLAGMVPADYVSIAWLDRARYHEDRVSMMTDDGHIIDQKRRWPIWHTTTRAVLQMNRPLFTPDLESLDGDGPGDNQNFEWHLGCRSRVVLPLRQGGRMLGTLTLAHRRETMYGENEARVLDPVANVIAAWLSHLEVRRTVREYETGIRNAARLEHDHTPWTTDQELLNAILDIVDATALRVYRLDASHEAMNLAASAGRLRGGDRNVPQPTRIAVADTPWHRWSLSDSRAHRIDQSDPERLMAEDEAKATMMARMKTGWIVPIHGDGKVLGFLDVMESRNPDRQTIREPQRLVLEAGARAFARLWQASATGDRAVPDVLRAQIGNLNGTIVNPITGIIGSVELIRHKQPDLTEEAVKYLNLIEHAASRIHEAVLSTMEGLSLAEPGTHDGSVVSQRLFGAMAMPSARLAQERINHLLPAESTVE